ncbi:MAG: hypothetical protein LBS36_09600 [Oscillospiraceae bacterium]|nr:hypothetical protein [Oscillospiraceae bacterium]
MTTRERYFNLLKSWCDSLLRRQLHDSALPSLDGSLWCDACAGVHGRCYDAVYPLLYLADETGETRYLDAAKQLMRWSDNLRCDDGSYYNGHHNAWNGTTVFFAASLGRALLHHGHLLDDETKRQWDERLHSMGDWLHDQLNLSLSTNINYFVSNAGALALLGEYFHESRFTEKARYWADFALQFIGRDGLLFGEGTPMDCVTARGCRAVDIGYNVEESLPMLALCAKLLRDGRLLQAAQKSIHAHLAFMLPDGGWDNSFGSRNFKWSYWGSRTSDGFQEAAAILGNIDPLINYAAALNLGLYERCTHDGLLYGGPHYAAHGEPPCIHHSFCHAKALASVLDAQLPEPPPEIKLPEAPALRYFSEIDTWKLHCGDFFATVTGYDVDYVRGGHASGGTMSLLWHTKTGPLVASSMTQYSLREPHNMQLTRRKAMHRSLTPGIRTQDGYASHDDISAEIHCSETPDGLLCKVKARLCNIRFEPREEDAQCTLEYRITPRGVAISGKTGAENARFVLPLIGLAANGMSFTPGKLRYPSSTDAQIICRSGNLKTEPQAIFFLSGGFEAWEVVLEPDANGAFSCEITVM